jgi:hypothetical protein
VAAARRDALAAGLAAGVAAEWGAIRPDSVDEALARLPAAWTVADMAQLVLDDVNVIDTAVHGCRETIWFASRQARFLFPPSTALLDALACAALAHVARFEYRLDLGDLDEATFLADQVLVLGADGGLDVAPWVRASMALARADLWRFRVGGDPDFADAAVRHIAEPASSGDPMAEALLAECLHARAAWLSPSDALSDLELAGELLERLLDPAHPLPQLDVLPWLQANWAALWCLVELERYGLTGDHEHRSRAIRLGRTAIDHVVPSTAEAEAAYLTILASVDVDDTSAVPNRVHDDRSADQASERRRLVAEQAEIAIEAGTGRYWYALQSALTHAESSLPYEWSQPATTSARIAFDIVDQTLNQQSSEQYRRAWLPWLARTAALAVPALATAGAPGPAVSRLEQTRTRILTERFYDDVAEIEELPADLRDVADPLARHLRVLRDPTVSRMTRATARDEVLRVTQTVRQRPGFEFFRWKRTPDDLLDAAGDSPIVYLAPGEPHGVAIVGGGDLGAWRSVPLPGCGPRPAPVAEFVDIVLARSAPAGARRLAVEPITRWLGQEVWGPLADLLAGVDGFWLVPCGYLSLLPCHAGRLDTLGADYALRRWDIRYAVTARSLALARALPTPPREPMFVGIPQPTGQVGLAGAQTEIRTVASAFAGGRILAAEHVTPSAALEAIRGAGYLHAACHGVADPDEPLMSGLELDGGERLTLHDLGTLRSALEVGVLSACETNVPDVSFPDEAMSLAVGLHLTGCRGVVASSWRVPDNATLALMDGFYRRWRGSEPRSLTEALRQSQLELADGDRWAEPYYWAGFSFLGASSTDNSRRPSSVRT